MNFSEQTLYADKVIMTHHVPPSEGGSRLDAFLKTRYRKRSRESLKRWIQSGSIQLKRDGLHHPIGKLKPSSQLLAGDEVHVISERKPEPEVDFSYRVHHEDDQLLVIEKPGNLPVHPAGSFFFHTLLIHLKTKGFQIPMKADREYYLVHRIDRETSGILILAKDREVCHALTQQFANRQTQKFYLAIIHGHPKEEKFQVTAAIRAAQNSRIGLKMETCLDTDQGALHAETRFQVIKSYGPYTLVACYPKTGRQHQIRLHLAHVGHPIVGDKLYSITDSEGLELMSLRTRKEKIENLRPKTAPISNYHLSRNIPAEIQAKLVLPRHALHAAGIQFHHPTDIDRTLKYACALPSDLQSFLLSFSQDPETEAKWLASADLVPW